MVDPALRASFKTSFKLKLKHRVAAATLCLSLSACATPSPGGGSSNDAATQDALTSQAAASAWIIEPFVLELRHPSRPTATLRLPRVRGGEPSAAAAINEALSTEALVELSAEQLQAEYAECACGFVGADYQVTRSQGPALSILLTLETLGAYPSSEIEYLSFDAQTGRRLSAATVFEPTRHDALIALLDEQVQRAIAQTLAGLTPEEAQDLAPSFEDLRFEAMHLDHFVFTEAGVRFAWSAELPHVIRALEPEGPFVLTWAQVASSLRAPYKGLADQAAPR